MTIPSATAGGRDAGQRLAGYDARASESPHGGLGKYRGIRGTYEAAQSAQLPLAAR